MGILTRGVPGIARRDADRELPRQPEGRRRALPRPRADPRPRGRDAPPRVTALRRLSSTALGRAPTGTASRCAGVDGCAARRARRSPSSAPTARASPRCCACWPACCARTPGPSRVLGEQLPKRGWAVRGRVGCSPTTRCSTATSASGRTCATTRACTASPPRASRSCSERSACSAAADDPVRTLSRGMVQRAAVCPRRAARPRAAAARRAARQPRPRRGRPLGRCSAAPGARAS